jgi:DNA-binding PadR family transcriptional regulator
MARESLGEFEQLVLLALLHLGGEAYGVPIVEEIERRTGRTASRAAVYIALRRLERKGLVTTRMEHPAKAAGRPRRFVRIQPDAVALVRSSRKAMDRMWRGLERVLNQR